MAEILSSKTPLDLLREANDKGVLLGLQDVSGIKPRVDIDVLLFEKPDTFNLFVLALSELQDMKLTQDKMGYYQLAGIHGLPTTFWDGVEVESKKRDPKNPGKVFRSGYCPHSSIKFITWHRAYLALYEQSLYVKMAEIAERYPEPHKQTYLSALEDFRLPFWDYYRPREKKDTPINGVFIGGHSSFPYNYCLPKVFTEQFVLVRKPEDNDTLVPIDNPFCKYPFPDAGTGGFDKDDWGHAANGKVFETKTRCTVRCPKDKDDAEGNPTFMNTAINNFRWDNNQYIVDLIIGSGQTFESFGSKAQTSGSSGNLESHHDMYHGLTGGGLNPNKTANGWMGYVPTAAFDPVFWIHHCKIDRDAAIWQAANPDTWAATPESISSLKEDNLPFRKQPGNKPKESFYDGNAAQYTQSYGNFYKDAVDMAPDDVRRNYYRLYNWSLPRDEIWDNLTPPDDMQPVPVEQAQLFGYSTDQPSGVPSNAGPAVGGRNQAAMGSFNDAESSDEPFAVAPSEAALSVNPSAVDPGTVREFAFTNIPKNATNVAPADVDESKYYRDWYIDNIVERLACNGPFVIYYFIGRFDGDNVETFSTETTLAGATYVFTSSRELCDNCGDAGDLHQLVTDTSPITSTLRGYLGRGLDDLTPQSVVPFLIENLKWRIVTHNGEQKATRDTAGFKVGISSKLTPRSGDGISGFLYQEFPQVIDTIITRANP